MKLFEDYARVVDGDYGRAAKDAVVHAVDFVGFRIQHRLWPVLWALGWAYRRLALRRVRIVAVIGSLGKTTTKRFIEQVLPGYRYGQSRRNANWAVPKNLLYARPWDKYWVMEVGIFKKGTMIWHGRLLRPDRVVFTSVASDHLRNFRDLDEIAAEKAVMLDCLADDGVIIYNGDDHRIAKHVADRPNQAVTFGFAADCTVRDAHVQSRHPNRTQVDLSIDGAPMASQVLPILGRGSVYAALAAIAVARCEDLAIDGALERLSRVTAAPGRMQVLALPSDSYVVCDDFKATPDSVDHAVRTIAALDRYRRILVCGEVEDNAMPYQAAYMAIGQAVAGAVDHLILVGHEDLNHMRNEAVLNGLPAQRVCHVGPDIGAVLPVLERLIVPRTVVLSKGASWQRMRRIGLTLTGLPVRCARRKCYNYLRPPCQECSLLR